MYLSRFTPTVFPALMMGLLVMALSAVGAEPASPEKTGLQVGKAAPQWELKDQDGQSRALASLLKQGPVALVFYRSADW